MTILDSAGNKNTLTCSVTVQPGSDVIVPDLSDMTLQEAQAAVAAVGLRLRATGKGLVVSQRPAADTPVPRGTVVTAILSNL